MSDRVTLLLLRLYCRVAFPLSRAGRRLDWLGDRWVVASLDVIFLKPESESESTRPLRLDRWLRKACRLEQEASNRRAAGKPFEAP